MKLIIRLFPKAIVSSFPIDSDTFPTEILSLQLSYVQLEKKKRIKFLSTI